ncbi:hypothetical protein QYY51_21995 [Enterobacter hormaechei]|uniref:hypothetical protein n=1 Tax=Enterobacter hormaechei TaxID=158836 RepID=UPI00263AD058|nr:hypothetical protein [Enterobacter hormaechei]MDN4966810.1 hypothetical protein [Enterobacter hormaechei]MDO0900832.1 hypothetical protein [Enterobacter hormaechei]MDO6154851.1 hypothetical protein [Enterobacter hormaechei]
MRTLVKRSLAVVLLLGSAAAGAASINITASFSPSLSNPGNNTFTNTTAQSGFCSTWGTICANGSMFSINTRITTKSNADRIYIADANPKDHVFFQLPPATNVEVKNVNTGSKHNVQFLFSAISARMYNVPSPGSGWGNSSFSYPQGGCSYVGSAVSNGIYYSFIWRISNKTSPSGCYKKRTSSNADISKAYMDAISIGYELNTPSPLDMESGVYKGSITFSVGPNEEISFGNKWDASDTSLTINLTLTVNHELRVSFPAEDLKVNLQPCVPNKICTPEQGQINWERWITTRVTPQLTGRSNFSLSSSGEFSVYLQCEYKMESMCAMKSSNDNQKVPVHTMLTLPSNVVNNKTGSSVVKEPIFIGKNSINAIFHTTTFGQNRSGHLDFLVKQRDVDTMLTTRPDTYSGAVTVIFDSNIY